MNIKSTLSIFSIILFFSVLAKAQTENQYSRFDPSSLKEKLEPWVQGELAKTLSAGVQAEFSKKIAGGFTIGPKDGSYFISFTDKTFDSLIAEYLRPVTRKLLFGE